MSQKRQQPINPVYLFAGGIIVLAVVLRLTSFVGPQTISGILTSHILQPPNIGEDCEGKIRPEVRISRSQLSQFLTIPDRSPRSRLQQLLQEPYCRLPPLPIRPDAKASREAYPLAFDPQVWLVVFYEGEQYIGYGFSFR